MEMNHYKLEEDLGQVKKFVEKWCQGGDKEPQTNFPPRAQFHHIGTPQTRPPLGRSDLPPGYESTKHGVGGPSSWDPWTRSTTMTPAQANAPHEEREHRSKFSEKVATMEKFQYDGEKGGAGWRHTMRNYFISKAPEIELILEIAESSEDAPAKVDDLILRSRRRHSSGYYQGFGGGCVGLLHLQSGWYSQAFREEFQLYGRI